MNELYHYGIKGMRWGIRNDETRARYARDRKAGGPRSESHIKEYKKQKRRELADEMTTQSIKRGKDKEKVSPAEHVVNNSKNIVNEASNINRVLSRSSNNRLATVRYDEARKLSDTELRNRINRMQMEKQYVQLKNENTRTGFDKANDVLDVIGSTLAATASALTITVLIKKLME